MKFTTFGSGNNNIIFLHGWGADSTCFSWVKNYITDAVLHIADLDGFGGEPAPDDPSVAGYANRLKCYIQEKDLDNVVLVGHSFGGRVAIEYASCNNVKGLVLVDSAGIKPKFSLKKKLKILRYKLTKKLVQRGLISISRLQGKGSQDYNACSDKLKRVLVSAVNYNQTKLLKNINCQTLIIWGKDDKDTPMYMAKKFNRLIKNSGLIVYPNSGHFSFINNAEAFAKTIDYFANNI